MKNNLKWIIIAAVVVIAIVVAMVLFIPQNEYRDDISSKDLISVGNNSFSTNGGTYENDDDKILDFTVDETVGLIDYIIIKANNAKNINEIGVFHVENGKVTDYQKIVEDYLSNLQASYRNMNYLPEETEKVDCAKVKVFGNYIVYSFLNENDTDAFYKAIENELTK